MFDKIYKNCINCYYKVVALTDISVKITVEILANMFMRVGFIRKNFEWSEKSDVVISHKEMCRLYVIEADGHDAISSSV